MERPLFMSIIQTRSPVKVKNSGQTHNIYYVVVFYVPLHKASNKPRIELFRKSYNINLYSLDEVFEIAKQERAKLTLDYLNRLS